MTPNTASFTLSRRFSVAPDRLWQLLTDPKSREIWGGPSDDTVLVLDVADLREGGHDRHRCGPAESPEFIVDTHWYHLDCPALACFTETVSAGGMRIGVSLVTYGLAHVSEGTELVVDVAVSSLTGEEMMEDFRDGWTSALNRMEKLITDGAFT